MLGHKWVNYCIVNYNMYKVSVAEDLKVKASYLRHYLFVTRFNIRFKSPSTDVCSTWLQLSEKIKVSNPQEVVNNLKTDLSINKTLASGFFDVIKKAEDNVAIISYDICKKYAFTKTSWSDHILF